MTMNPQLEKAFNAQITMEYAAAYSYLGMSAWFETRGLPGMASWMLMQSNEETGHGLRLFRFVLDRGGKVFKQSAPDSCRAGWWRRITKCRKFRIFRRPCRSDRRASAPVARNGRSSRP